MRRAREQANIKHLIFHLDPDQRDSHRNNKVFRMGCHHTRRIINRLNRHISKNFILLLKNLLL